MLQDLVQNVRIGSYFKVTGSGLALRTVNGLIPGQEAVMSLPQIHVCRLCQTSITRNARIGTYFKAWIKDAVSELMVPWQEADCHFHHLIFSHPCIPPGVLISSFFTEQAKPQFINQFSLIHLKNYDTLLYARYWFFFVIKVSYLEPVTYTFQTFIKHASPVPPH